MSELKEHLFVPYSELREGDELTDAFTIAKSYYLKSEADKVIAEKDAEIERLENLCATYRHDCDNLAISNKQAKRAARTLLKKMNYNKYKRCLAMANYCKEATYYFEERLDKCSTYWRVSVKKAFYERWRKRWLKLAEKFKEGSL